MVRRAKRARADQLAAVERPRDRCDHRNFERFSRGERRQYARQRGGEQRLARARRTGEQQVMHLETSCFGAAHDATAPDVESLQLLPMVNR